MGELILNKKYKLHSSENFEEFMKALGKLYIFFIDFLNVEIKISKPLC